MFFVFSLPFQFTNIFGDLNIVSKTLVVLYKRNKYENLWTRRTNPCH